MANDAKTCAQHIADVISQRNLACWMQSGMPQDIIEYGTQAEDYWDRRLTMLMGLVSDESGYDVAAFADECNWEFLAFEVVLYTHDAEIRRHLRLEVRPTFGMVDVSAFNDAGGEDPADDDEAWAVLEAVSEVLDDTFVHEYGDDDADMFGDAAS